MEPSLGTHQPPLFHVLRLLGRFFQLERRVLALVVSYALVIGLFGQHVLPCHPTSHDRHAGHYHGRGADGRRRI